MPSVCILKKIFEMIDSLNFPSDRGNTHVSFINCLQMLMKNRYYVR